MRSAAWLALVAMLLIFAGPLFSNSQALLHAQNQPDLPPGFDLHAPGAFCGDVPASAFEDNETPANLAAYHAECGYCILLTHASPLASAGLAIGAPPFWAAPQTVSVQEVAYLFRPYDIAQGRAPPTITV